MITPDIDNTGTTSFGTAEKYFDRTWVAEKLED